MKLNHPQIAFIPFRNGILRQDCSKQEHMVDFSKQSKQGAALFTQSGNDYLAIFWAQNIT